MFIADYPGAIVFPAHPTNYYRPNEAPQFHAPNWPRGWVLHTPEEPADDNESTPAFFAAPNRSASTHYYMDSDGDVYQLVPENCAAIANGVIGKPYPAWADPAHSLNWQALSVEIEGFAATIQHTLIRGGPQWRGLVALIRDRARAYAIPLDREHIIGHYQVSNQRSDPGAWFPWVALMEDLQAAEEDGDEMYIVTKANTGHADSFKAYLVRGREFRHIPDAEHFFSLAALSLPLYEPDGRAWEFMIRGSTIVE